MYTVAVSYLEWIRWIAAGWFRCSGRVVWVEGYEDQRGMDALMASTPDLPVTDDQGYLIACLKPNALHPDRHDVDDRSFEHLWISVAGVNSFHPLSNRGARLLESDAERAATRLGEPLFENVWVNWRDRRIEDEAHWRGRMLCEAFGLQAPDLSKVPHPVDNILAGRTQAPNAVDLHQKNVDTRAFGWASAMSIALISESTRAGFNQTPEFQKIKSLIKLLREDFDLRSPLLSEKENCKLARDIDKVCADFGAQSIPLELMATVLHYRYLASDDRKLSLDALLKDLTHLTLVDPHLAAIAAYYIGRSMENVAVTSLLYQSNPSCYTAIRPKKVLCELNIMARASALCEGKTQVEQAQQTALNVSHATLPANVDLSSDASVASVGAKPVEDKQHVNLEPTTQDDVFTDAISGNPSPPERSTDETLKNDSINSTAASSQVNTTSGPSGIDTEGCDQSDKFRDDGERDLFPQSAPSFEPPGQKVKVTRKRKKPVKVPKETSVPENSNERTPSKGTNPS